MTRRESERRTRRQDRRPTIGLLVTNVAEVQASEVWGATLDMAHERGANSVCFNVGMMYRPDSAEADSRTVGGDLVSAESIDGLVTFLWWDSREWFERATNRYRPLPVVNVMRLYAGYPGVAWENYQVMYDLVSHLIEVHGYRRIAYIGLVQGNPIAEERYQAYVDVLARHGIAFDPRLVMPGDYPRAGGNGQSGIRFLLEDQALQPNVDLEAVVAHNDTDALQALTALHERGVRVPDDVAVVGVDNIGQGAISVPPLTTVSMPRREMGKRATEMLLSLLDDVPVDERVTIPGPLVVRQSCGCSDPVLAQVMVGSGTSEARSVDGSFAGTASARRGHVLADMAQAAGVPSGAADGWPKRLLDAFVSDLSPDSAEAGMPASFLAVLSGMLRQADGAGDDIDVWEDLLWAVRRHASPVFADDAEMRQRADLLWQQGRVLIGRMMLQAQAHRQMQADQLTAILRETATDLFHAREHAELADVLERNLPRLGIPSCYLSLYQDPEVPTGQSCLVMAYDERGRIHLEPARRVFPSRQLVPEGLLSERKPYNLVVEPLFFAQSQLGFVVFEAGPRETTVYEVLCEQISSALWNIGLLSERCQAKVERECLLADVERRGIQLQAVAEVSRVASKILDPDGLIWEAVELVRGRFGLYYVGLFLVDGEGQWAVLRAGTGTQGQTMVERGHRLAVGGDSMIGQCVALGDAQIALDVALRPGRASTTEPGTDDRRFANPLLPDTRSEMALPLVSRGETLGAVTIQSTEQAAFSEEDVAALQTMADQLAVAIGNARLFEQAQAHAEELVVLNELNRVLATVRTVDEVMVSTYQYVSRLTDATSFYIGLYDRARNQVTIPLNVTESEVDRQITVIPADGGLTGYVLRTRESLLIKEDVSGWQRARDIEVVGQVSQSWLGVPLLIGETVLGVMAIQDYTKPRAFTEADRERMISVANQATLAIQNTRLFEEIQARARYEQTLREISARVRSSTDPDAIVRTTVRELGRALGRRVFVRMGDEESLSRSEKTGLEGGI